MSASNDTYDGRLLRALVALMFFTFAMTTDAVGSVIPAVIAEFSLSMTAASAFQYATMAGIAAGALLLGFLADRLGRKRTVIVGLALYGAASLVFEKGIGPKFIELTISDREVKQQPEFVVKEWE